VARRILHTRRGEEPLLIQTLRLKRQKLCLKPWLTAGLRASEAQSCFTPVVLWILSHLHACVPDDFAAPRGMSVIKWDHRRTRPTKDHFFPKSKKKMLMGAKTIFVICC
jgi:hypothetical protein